MYRYFSPDGINWTVSEGPVLEVAVPGVRLVIPYENPMHTADTTYIFREADGTYMATHKLGEPAHPGGLVPYDVFAEGRRVMARRTSPDGSNWSPFETIIQPDIYDPQDIQIMELCVTPVRSGYLGVIGIYLNRTQTMELHLGGSVDGRIWDRRVRLPAVATGALGDYGGGSGPRITSSSTAAGTTCTSRPPRVCMATRHPRVPAFGRSSPPSAGPAGPSTGIGQLSQGPAAMSLGR